MRTDTVPTLFHSQATKYGTRVALRRKQFGIWRDISWNEYLENVRAVALGLVVLGLKKGECVSVIGENRQEWLYADLGIQAAGGVTTGIYSTNSPEQCQYIVAHSDSRFYFVENEEQLDKTLIFRQDTPRLEKIIVMDMEGLKHFHDPMVMGMAALQDLGREIEGESPDRFEDRLQETKGAMLTHRNVLWTAATCARVFGVTDTDELLSYLPLCHIAERMFSLFIAIAHGYTVSFVEHPETIPQNMREISPTVLFGVPRIFEKLHSAILINMSEATPFKKLCYHLATRIGTKVSHMALDHQAVSLGWRFLFGLAHLCVLRKLREHLGLERVRVAISAAAPISPDVIRYFRGVGVNMRELYGQTEGSGPTTMHQGDSIKLGTVGRPFPGMEVRIADDGEILVKGPNVFKGYFKDPEATKETLVKGWLHSGDVGEIDGEGNLRITDRKKDLIITAAGKNIAPQNIENQLKFSPYINDAVVIGDGRRYLTALVMIDEENVVKYAQDNRIPFTTFTDLSQKPEVGRLIQVEVDKVNKTLAQVETIKRFTVFHKRLDPEDGEVTPTMKVKRKFISETYGDVIEAMYRSG
jgi:long-chain acyl-CoA synthetase